MSEQEKSFEPVASDAAPHVAHTPWRAYAENDNSDNCGRFEVIGADGRDIAMIRSAYRSVDEQRAHAHLIAAAPDMLSALKFIANRRDLMFAECSDAEEIIAVAKASISKAEGKV